MANLSNMWEYKSDAISKDALPDLLLDVGLIYILHNELIIGNTRVIVLS
jgi:hypothetical protein